MKIHYIQNAWSHKIPIEYYECCESMNKLYSLETKPHNGFWLDPSDGELKEYSGGKVVGVIDRCWFCKADIEVIKRELKPL